MEKLRTGIIGCGKVADFHAKAFVNSPMSSFTAVCGRNPERTKAFADKYGVRAYTDPEEMCRREKLDVVSICTPHPNHAAMAVLAADCGCNVIVEKPLASSLADCDAIIAAGERNHVTIGTMVQRRFYRPCMRIRQAIDAGKIGNPMLGMVTMLGWRDQKYYDSDAWRGTWTGEGGGVLVNQAPHQLDLLLWYKGDPNLLTEAIGFLCAPVVAITIALLVSIFGLFGHKTRSETIECMERGIKSCGTIILITGAGGAFGNIIKSSGIGNVIAEALAASNMPVLLLPFLMAGILKLVLGSGTVAMTTTATICAPILMQIPGANMMFCAYAACIGAQMFSLQNDSFFWILTRTFKIDNIKTQMLGYEGMQFIWSWVGFGLLSIVNLIF